MMLTLFTLTFLIDAVRYIQIIRRLQKCQTDLFQKLQIVEEQFQFQ